MKKVLIMAGGTGGHVFPALSCAREFARRGYEVHWLGTPRGIENELVPEAGIPLHRIDIAGLRGKGRLALLKAPVNILRALCQAWRILRQLRPVCVLGFGGFVTGPGGVAARLGGIPLVIHEQNAKAGTANRGLVPFAARVCEGFPDTFVPMAKKVVTGNPVRPELFDCARQRPAPEGRLPRLLVLGGSLGAEPLNQLLPRALQQLDPALRPQVLHQAGKQHVEITQERYQEAGVDAEVVPFISDMAATYTWADLVICRAGALTVCELAAVALPALLIPLPHAIDDHQTHNAGYLVQGGAGVLLPQKSTSAEQLARLLSEILADPERLQSMRQAAQALARPEATARVVDICEEVAHGQVA